VNLYRGALVGCYNCHDGPGGDAVNNGVPPVVGKASGNTPNTAALTLPIAVTPPSAALRIVSQPANGSLGISGSTLTYFPAPGFTGTETFTYAAWDGSKNSGLATGTVAVVQGPFAIAAAARVPPSYPARWPVAFGVVPTTEIVAEPVAFEWDFGDGEAHATNQFAIHEFAAPGTYTWSVIARVSGISATRSGSIVVGKPVTVAVSVYGNLATLAWPDTLADTLLESTVSVGADAPWTPVTNVPTTESGMLRVTRPLSGDEFFRVSRPW
jgi:hypothetical protein